MRTPWMLASVLALAAGATGCSTHCEDCTSGPAELSATVLDDGVTLTVLGCVSIPFDGGCLGSGEPMVATIDGTTMTVPTLVSDDAVIGAIEISYDHRLDLPSPASPPQISATYDGSASVTLAGLPAFSITGPTTTVSRGSGAISVDFDVEQDTVATVLLTSTCGSDVYVAPTTADKLGHLELDLAYLGAEDGSCTHRVDVAQTREQFLDPAPDLSETIVRLQALTFGSTP